MVVVPGIPYCRLLGVLAGVETTPACCTGECRGAGTCRVVLGGGGDSPLLIVVCFSWCGEYPGMLYWGMPGCWYMPGGAGWWRGFPIVDCCVFQLVWGIPQHAVLVNAGVLVHAGWCWVVAGIPHC